jgi:hypothetical protein
MSSFSAWAPARAATVAGQIVGAAGIAILWAAGLAFPFAVPPGIVILLAGAVFVTLSRRRWSPAVGSGGVGRRAAHGVRAWA